MDLYERSYYKNPSFLFYLYHKFMYSLRTIQAKDNTQLAQIIREVSKEFNLAPESGFAVADPILDQLFAVYSVPHSQYWVIEDEHGHIFGGGGLAPLKGDESILEIQKMYFLPEVRGFGFAKKILELAFAFTQQQGLHTCYLETTKQLFQAVKLYEKLGFQHLTTPKGNTGHSHACEIWMLKTF